MKHSNTIMTEIGWGFYGCKYSSLNEFVVAVNRYNEFLGVQWNPHEIVLECKEVTVQYSYWDFIKEDDIVDEFDLVADSYGFTAQELLFKIHNSVVDNLNDDDKHFFEGLTLWYGENYSKTGVPLYFLNQGS